MPESLNVMPSFQSLLSAHGLRTLDAIFAWGDGAKFDKPGLESWRQRWRMQLTDGAGKTHVLYLKRFDRPPLCRQRERWCAGAFFASTAAVEWGNARALADAGIHAAQAVALGEDMCGPLERRSCVILSEATGESLERWVPANVPPIELDPDRADRRARLDALARFVARFHAAGFVHRDLYLCHIFFDEDIETRGASRGKEATEHPFCLIDLSRVFKPRWRRQRWVVKDLTALNVSTPPDRVGQCERLRFLCRYAKECTRFGSARTLARRIEAKTQWMLRRQARAAGKAPRGNK